MTKTSPFSHEPDAELGRLLHEALSVTDDPAFAREVIAIIPEFLEARCVVGIGEIGLNKNTKNELVMLEEQIALAAEYNQLILVHTPHLEDKLKGTRLIIDTLQAHGGIRPER